MPLYYRCKSCSKEHLSPIVFPDRHSYHRTHLSRPLLVCPDTNGAARYDKSDLFWRTDLPISSDRGEAESAHGVSASVPSRILIVDDEEVMVWALEKLLQQAGYREIASTTDSREACTIFHAFRPDILLLDLQMPHLGGFGVLRALRPHLLAQPYFPVLLLTGEVRQEAKMQALAEGAKDFISKPFEHLEVLLRVRTLLELRSLHIRVQQQARLLERELWERGQEDEQRRSAPQRQSPSTA